MHPPEPKRTVSWAPRREEASLEAVAALAFLVFGVALILPGAAQPALAAALGLDLSASGLVASALSLGLGVGVVAGGPLADRLPRRPLFAASAGLAGLSGLALAGGGSFAAALAATAGIGLGAGLYETLLNAAVPERAPAHAAARLSLLHAMATLGAGLGAPVFGAFAQGSGFAAAYGALGAAFAVLAGLGLAVRFPAPPPAPRAGAPGAALRVRALAPWAGVAFAYVGLETALSVFAVPYARGLGLDAGRGMRSLSAFWLGLLVARIAFALLRRAPGARQLRLAGGAGALALAGGALSRAPAPELLFLAAGLALGVVFPLVVWFAGEAWPARRASAVGLVVGAGSLGGFAVPWLAGEIGDRLGPAAAVAALAALALGIAGAARAPRASR
jgi:fucose permease